MTAESRPAVCLDAEQLAAFADGGLSPSERESIETHLSECDHCYEALVGIAAITAQIAAPVAPARSRVRRSAWWIGGALAAAASVVLLVKVSSPLRSPFDPLDRAITNLAEAPRETRLSLGRLSVDRTYAAASSVQRSDNAVGNARDPFDLRRAALALKVLTAQDHSSRGLHYHGLALVASREFDTAVEAFEQALRQSGADEALIRSDLSAALLERYRLTEQAADAERALAEADRALSAAPNHLNAAFNRAQVLERLGRPEARQAWQAYLDLDRDTASQWRAEAIRLRDGQR